jgi:hypothetical protein
MTEQASSSGLCLTVLDEDVTILGTGHGKMQVVVLTQDILCPGGPDDNLCPHGSHPDLYAGVAMLSQLSGKEFVELGVEHSIGYKLQAYTKDLLRRHS